MRALGDQSANLVQHGRLYLEPRLELRLAAHLCCPQQLVEGVFELLFAQGRVGGELEAFRLGLVEAVDPGRRRGAELPQLADLLQGRFPGPFRQPPLHLLEAAPPPRPAPEHLPQNNDRYQPDKAEDEIQEQRKVWHEGNLSISQSAARSIAAAQGRYPRLVIFT